MRKKTRPDWPWLPLAVSGVLWFSPLQAIENKPLPPAPAVRPVGEWRHLSPVEFFRGLLGMSPSEREKALASRPAADHQLILAKLQEYEAMPHDLREARLCQTELHWELSLLMRLPPAQRGPWLGQVSALYRPLIEGLLQQWDAVPASTQKSLLEKQSFIALYLRMQGNNPVGQEEILASLTPARRERWVAELGRWQSLPESERLTLCQQFQRFCALNGQEQQRTFAALSPEEQKEMEMALRTFNLLPPLQRSMCINSFSKFAAMDPIERAQFLENAARWDAMTREERQVWRQLVKNLPPLPPLPPGFPNGLPPMPPALSHGPPMPPMPPNVMTPVIVAGISNEYR